MGFQRPNYQQNQQSQQQFQQQQQGYQQQGMQQPGQGYNAPGYSQQSQGYPQGAYPPQQVAQADMNQYQQPQPMQLNQPATYQINAATYAAYPEHDPEFIQKGISYQHGSVQKGWNDPPVVSKTTIAYDVMPKADMIGKLTQMISIVKQRSPPQKQRMIDDTERRIDSFFDQLESYDNSECLGGLTGILNSLESRDFQNAKSLITNLMVKFQDQSKWLLGVKRLIDLVEVC